MEKFYLNRNVRLGEIVLLRNIGNVLCYARSAPTIIILWYLDCKLLVKIVEYSTLEKQFVLGKVIIAGKAEGWKILNLEKNVSNIYYTNAKFCRVWILGPNSCHDIHLCITCAELFWFEKMAEHRKIQFFTHSCNIKK